MAHMAVKIVELTEFCLCAAIPLQRTLQSYPRGDEPVAVGIPMNTSQLAGCNPLAEYIDMG